MGFKSINNVDLLYRPSWADRLSAVVASLPIPSSLTYSLAAILLTAMFLFVQWWQGAYSQDGFFGWHIFIALQPLVPLAAIHYLDAVAGLALLRFRSSFNGDEQAFQQVSFRLTTTPSAGTLVASFIGVVSSILLFGFLQDLDTSFKFARLATAFPSKAVYLIYILTAWFGFGAWIFHTIHQLRVIHEVYTAQSRVDPAYPEPLYALSTITSRTALIILANTYGWFGVNAATEASAPTHLISLIITNLFFLGLGLLIFIWPLWGAHRLLEQAKGEALAKNAHYLNQAIGHIHRQIADANVGGIDSWEKALAGLQHEKTRLERMATWPWSPGTLRNFLIALVVPIVVWFVQFGLERLLE